MRVDGRAQDAGTIWRRGGADGSWASAKVYVDLSSRWDGGRLWRLILERVRVMPVENALNRFVPQTQRLGLVAASDFSRWASV